MVTIDKLTNIVRRSYSVIVEQSVLMKIPRIVVTTTICRIIYKKVRVKSLVKEYPADVRGIVKLFVSKYKNFSSEISDYESLLNEILMSIAAMPRLRDIDTSLHRFERKIQRLLESFYELGEALIQTKNTSIATTPTADEILSKYSDVLVKEARHCIYSRAMTKLSSAVFNLTLRFIKARESLGSRAAEMRLEGFEHHTPRIMSMVRSTIMELHAVLERIGIQSLITSGEALDDLVLKSIRSYLLKVVGEQKEQLIKNNPWISSEYAEEIEKVSEVMKECINTIVR